VAPTFSVSTRITVAVAVLVALALAGTGAIVYVLARDAAEERVLTAVDQEVAEFRAFQENASPPYRSTERLVRDFLANNIGTASELLVGYWSGETTVSSFSERGELKDTPVFEAAADDLAVSGGSTRIQSEWGTVHLEVQPISDGGAFIVAYFVDDETDPLNRVMRTYAVGGGLALLLVTAFASWLSGRLLRPVRTLRETAEAIEESDLSRRIAETGNDDITALTRTLNAMLDRLERAFAGQRAFLDDAGHELRTPLTIVQGHLEVLDEHDPADVERTRELVLDEVDRMSRLVDDLILLAKAERPDFFSFEEVEVGPLFDLVVDKCRALGGRDWQVDARAGGRVILDEQRITQAYVQLAQNAVKHTSPGDTVALGSAMVRDGSTLRLWVRDTGSGVPDEYKQVIFERLGRGPVGPDDEGFGLGLSIVSAIVAGHAGTVGVQDTVPHGATFVMEIPIRRSHGWPAS
jgi:signal transduction histidine kinase